MEIQKINQGVSTFTGKNDSAPAFTGNASKIVETVEDQFLKSVPKKSVKALEFLKNFQKKYKGEAGGILITAVGTGLVAPFFIGFNPFVKAPKGATEEQKQDVKNTKMYTAMRQPISAVLAILFQLSILKLIDKKFIDPIFNNPEYAKYLDINKDQSILNNKSYLETLVKQEMKNEGIEKPRGIKAKKVYKQQVESRIRLKQEEQLSALAKDFETTGLIKIGERNLPNETVAELINGQIDSYVKDAEALKIDAKGLERYPKRAKCLIDNEQHLREIFKDIPYAEIDKTTDSAKLKDLYKQTEATLKDLLAKEKNPEVKELLTEILDKSEDLRASRVERTLERIETLKDKCGGKFSVEKYNEFLTQRNSKLGALIEDLNKLKIQADGKPVTKETIQSTIKKLAETCTLKESEGLLKSTLHNTGTFNTNTKSLLSKVYKDVTKGYKKLLENSCTASNQIIKILIGVCITLQITCNVLNWIYPRFMELAFPKLAGVKKDKTEKAGGDK